MRTRMLGALVAVLCLAVLALPGAARAADVTPAPDKIGLSWDRLTWSQQLSGTLFDGPDAPRIWVPGDSDTDHFYVRDQGGDAARLAVDYDLSPGGLADPDDVVVTARVAGGTPVTLAPGTGWLPVDGTALADGQDADVAVTATFRPSSTNSSQRQRLSIAFRVTLTEITGPGTDTGGGPATDSGPGNGHGGHSGPPSKDRGPLGGPLPDTGAPEVRWALGLGLVALGGGIAIVVLSRRKEEHDAEAS